MARFSLVKDENLSMIVESSAGKEARVIRLVKWVSGMWSFVSWHLYGHNFESWWRNFGSSHHIFVFCSLSGLSPLNNGSARLSSDLTWYQALFVTRWISETLFATKSSNYWAHCWSMTGLLWNRSSNKCYVSESPMLVLSFELREPIRHLHTVLGNVSFFKGTTRDLAHNNRTVYSLFDVTLRISYV